MTKPEWLFHEPIVNIQRKIYNPKPLKQIAIENIEIDGKKIEQRIS